MSTRVPGAKRGRMQRYYEEARAKERTEAERDHDRILYTSALQRLAGITQIAAPEFGPTIHNRLTHTLKVAQVARRLAKRLGLDSDGQETAAAAALAHDLGHPPFGHLAERALDEKAKAWGGFNGNAQSFRIVTFLALRSDDYRGLNLTRRTLNAILKYPWLRDAKDQDKSEKWGAYESERSFFEFARADSSGEDLAIEASIMDWADDVTYAVHDLEDFFRVGLIPLDRLVVPKGIERKRFFDSFFEDRGKGPLRAKFREKGLSADNLSEALEYLFSGPFFNIEPYRGSKSDRTDLRYQTSYLIGEFVENASRDGGSVDVKPAIKARVAVLKELAWYYVITDPSLATIQRGQRVVIEDLHDIYCGAVTEKREEKWQLFPLGYRELIPLLSTDAERRRLATDFVASLTEKLAYELHHRLTGISPGSIMDAAAHASR